MFNVGIYQRDRLRYLSICVCWPFIWFNTQFNYRLCIEGVSFQKLGFVSNTEINGDYFFTEFRKMSDSLLRNAEPEPEPPGAASFCLEPEPEPPQVGRSRSLLRDLGHQEPEPEPPKKVAAPQQWFCPYFCHETLCCAKGHKRRLPSPDKKEIFLTRKPNAIFMSTLSKIIFYWEVWWESNMTSMKIFSFNI